MLREIIEGLNESSVKIKNDESFLDNVEKWFIRNIPMLKTAYIKKQRKYGLRNMKVNKVKFIKTQGDWSYFNIDNRLGIAPKEQTSRILDSKVKFVAYNELKDLENNGITPIYISNVSPGD